MLALGATPKKLALKPDVQKDALYSRTLDDAKRLASECAGKNVAIVGAGMLGGFGGQKNGNNIFMFLAQALN